MKKVLFTISAIGIISLTASAQEIKETKPAEANNATLQTIAETAIKNGIFAKMLAAMEAAGMQDILKGKSPYTIFMMSDAAFKKLPEGALEDMMKPENKENLKRMLNSHIVQGKFMSSDLMRTGRAQTVGGKEASISETGNVLRFDNATIVTKDIECSNGVIHIIDMISPDGK